MSLLPATDAILLGPGPSMTSPRVIGAMLAPTLSHLDPVATRLMDDIRARLVRLFGAVDGSFALAVSGTGTAGMETAVANLGEVRELLFRPGPPRGLLAAPQIPSHDVIRSSVRCTRR